MNKLKLNKKNKSRLLKITFGVFIAGILISSTGLSNPTFANTEEIKNLADQINDKRKQLERLDAEIAQQRKLLSETSGQATTLQSRINSLEANRRKIVSEIRATEVQIERAELSINKLDLEITDKQKLINSHSDAIGESIRRINATEKRTLVERFLSSENFSDFWLEFEQNVNVQNRFKEEIDSLLGISQDLRETQSEKEKEKSLLAMYKKELDGQAEAVASTRNEQQTILQRTKNQEAEYQRLLKEKENERLAFEKELLDIESKIKFLIDPNSFPSAQRGVFVWPLDSIRVTQQFGGSQFAATNPGIYGRPFHPGTDFGAAVGTKVKSIGPGIIKGSGNTDAFPGCNAWGKWILVEHDNGISSLYAHLSSVIVSNGQRVTAGETIALSGNTGVTTGPHLHLTLYASQGVRIDRYGTYRPGGGGCAATNATGPFADLNAYLDPMSYLPAL